MDFFETNEHTTTEIVELLKLSLGEGTTQKSNEFWNWKHLDNPFGASKIILAKEDNILVGVRAFMRWNFESNKAVYNCVRAVDTAVHPNFQGKGIFTKLTLKAIDECKKEGDSLIFNTPNKISKQGYLKMGWIENGRMPLSISLSCKLPRKFSQDFLETVYEKYHKEVVDLNFKIEIKSIAFETTIDSKYLDWRYLRCPVLKYGILSDANNYFIAFRLKKIGSFIELRICDVSLNNNSKAAKNAADSIKELASFVKPLFISCANIQSIHKDFYKQLNFSSKVKIGPINTLKNLNCDSLDGFVKFKNWQPSLGCMELF